MWPNQTDIHGPTQILFNIKSKTTGVKIIQNKSKELTKLKYVFDLLTVYFVKELKIGSKYVIKDVSNNK